MILAITGHRPNALGGYRIPNTVYNAVIEALDKEIIRLMPDRIITGMALGTDQWAARLAINSSIPFQAVVPFPDFSSNWPPHARVTYSEILSQAETVLSISGEPGYTPEKMRERNRYMVSVADALLAVWNDSPVSGTAQTVRIAERLGKPVYKIHLPENIWMLAANYYTSTRPLSSFTNTIIPAIKTNLKSIKPTDKTVEQSNPQVDHFRPIRTIEV